jgi:hypothetical protein
MKASRFYIALITVVIYEFFMNFLDPNGFSFVKVGITLLAWISLYQSVSIFILRYNEIRDVIPVFAFRIFVLLICWNFINIIRSAVDPVNSVTTLLGNPATSLALLIPFSLSFCIDRDNLPLAYNFFLNLILISLPFYFIFLLISDATSDQRVHLSFQSLLYGTIFLISVIPFLSSKKKLLILAGSVMLFLIAVQTEYRTMMLRIILVFITVAALYFFKRYNLRIILIAAFLLLFLPFFFLAESIRTRQSAFEKYQSLVKDQELGMDTRTFLYTEVYDDLNRSKMLTTGKGSIARYYSPYFSVEEGDNMVRLSVEAGILAILLSGGFIAVFLNLMLLLTAIYLALFRSKNYFVVSIGFFLIVHTILLFIESFVVYSLYNLVVWFLIGICLSNDIRTMSNNGIYKLLFYENK